MPFNAQLPNLESLKIFYDGLSKGMSILDLLERPRSTPLRLFRGA